MLNEKKIRLMTKLALFEEKEGKEELKLDRYYRIDYIRYQVLKSIVCLTVGYLLILMLILLYQSEHILDTLPLLDYKTIGIYVLIIYLFLVVFYSFITGIVSYFRYDRARKKMRSYKKNLKALRLFYKEEGEL